MGYRAYPAGVRDGPRADDRQLLLVDFIEFILLSFSVFGRRSVECHGG